MNSAPPVSEKTLRLRRLGWGLSAVPPVLVLATAAYLTPSASGFGTHTQLGLPPCGFLLMTGLPCPGCGLTTAFANMIRGNVLAAVIANPFGVPLFIATCVFVPIAIYAALRMEDPAELFVRLRLHILAPVLFGSAILVWVIRVAHILLRHA